MPKSYADLVSEAKQNLILTEAADLKQRADAGEEMVIIDVREPDEWERGTIPGALTIPRGVLEIQIGKVAQPDDTVVLYCGGGGRSALAGRNLREMGYDKVENLEGGFSGWAGSGMPVTRQS